MESYIEKGGYFMYITITAFFLCLLAIALICCFVQFIGQLLAAWVMTSKPVIRRYTKKAMDVTKEMCEECDE